MRLGADRDTAEKGRSLDGEQRRAGVLTTRTVRLDAAEDAFHVSLDPPIWRCLDRDAAEEGIYRQVRSFRQLGPAEVERDSAEPGKAGLGLNGQRIPVPRGKMLGGSSSINYMVYVRGHPGDFNAWAAGGADGWSYDDVLPYFRKSEGLTPSGEVVIDAATILFARVFI